MGEMRVLLSEQIRGARALVGMRQRELATLAGVSVPTVRRIEGRPGVATGEDATVTAIRAVLEHAGIEFTFGEQPGVRLKREKARR